MWRIPARDSKKGRKSHSRRRIDECTRPGHPIATCTLEVPPPPPPPPPPRWLVLEATDNERSACATSLLLNPIPIPDHRRASKQLAVRKRGFRPRVVCPCRLVRIEETARFAARDSAGLPTFCVVGRASAHPFVIGAQRPGVLWNGHASPKKLGGDEGERE